MKSTFPSALAAVFLAVTVHSQVSFSTLDSGPGFSLLRVSMALGSDGLPILAYDDYAHGDLKVVKCVEAGCASGNTMTPVDTVGKTGLFPSIAVPADGRPVICYTDFLTERLRVLKCGGSDCRSGNSISKLDTVLADGLYTAIAAPADGRPVIVFQDHYQGGEGTRILKLLKCGNPECTSGNVFKDLDTSFTFPSQHSLAIGSDGLPVLSYRKNGLKILKCGNADCTAGNTSTLAVPDTGKYLAVQTSLKVPSDGLPVVAYSNLDRTGMVKVLKCGNASCSSGNTTARVDSNDVHITFLSLALGADDLPVLGFFRNPKNSLVVVKCGNPSCAEGNVATELDSADKLGTAVAVAVPPDGRPVIAYNDARTSLLKVAKCGSSNCQQVTASRAEAQAGGLGISILDGVLSLNLPSGPGRLEIFDLSGTKVYSKTFANTRTVEVPGLIPGIHFARYASLRGTRTGRFIVP